MNRRVAVLISGRGSNLERILAEVASGCLRDVCEIVGVLSNRSAAPGLEIARRADVPTLVVPSTGRGTAAYGRELLAAVEPWDVEYLVLAGFMRILSAAVVDRYRGRIVNIHPADTAEYQGADGYRWAFERGMRETMVTVHLVDEGIDTGAVLARACVSLDGASTLAAVVERGLRVEHELYSRTLRGLLAERATADAEKERRTRCAES